MTSGGGGGPRPQPDPSHGGPGQSSQVRGQSSQVRGQRLIPRTVTIALAVVGIEVVALLLVAAFLVGLLAQNADTERGVTVATLVFSVLMVGGLTTGGFAILRGRRWGRAPLVTWQLLQLFVAAPALSTAWPIGAALVALSVVGLATLLSPSVTKHIRWREVAPGMHHLPPERP